MASSSSSDRRRTPERRKPSKVIADKGRISAPSWLNEAASLLCAALALLILVSIWQVGLRGITGAEQHFFGAAGVNIGAFFYKIWGAAAFSAVFALSVGALMLWQTELEFAKQPASLYAKFFLVRSIGAIACLTLIAGLASTLGKLSLGGKIGALIAAPMLHALNVTGAAVVLIVAIVLSLSIATGSTVYGVLAGIKNSTWWTVSEFPRLAWSALSNATVAIYRSVRSLVWVSESEDRLIARKEFEERQDSIDVPRPRLRKNSLAKGSLSDEVEVESGAAVGPASRDYSHVVVMRRDQMAQAKRDAKRKAAVALPVPETDYSDAFPAYRSPPVDVLTKGEPTVGGEDDEELRAMSRQIEIKLKDFGVIGRVTQVHPGPVITLFEFDPAPGVKLSRIVNLQEDLSMSLKATSLRIIAPLPKRGTVGIEVPNRKREMVRLREVIESEQYSGAESLLTIGLGKDTYGDPVSVDLASMPHLLIAGSTGTGKSVCINSILLSLLYRAHPSELGLILIDPKVLELSTYEDIPHLRVPVVTVPRQAKAVLDWAAHEMDRRYRMMQRFGVRNIDGYNAIVKGEAPNPVAGTVGEGPRGEGLPNPPIELSQEDVLAAGVPPDGEQSIDPVAPETLRLLPKIVIVIDELADLMLTVGRDIEELITRLAQKARASGIHLIIATQRPSVDVITGLIKANFPARLSFRVAQKVDSRTILDQMGAEKLLGKGDMLFMAPGADSVRRLHGAFVSDSEVNAVVSAIKGTAKPTYDERILALCKKALEDEANAAAQGGGGEVGGEGGEGEYDSMYDRAVEMVLQKGQASTSMLQRAFRIGYNRAARMIEMMEKEGVIGPADGARPREVLASGATQVDS